MPQRIQRKRTKGWKMPEGAIYVGRGSKWGNPFVIGEPSGIFDGLAGRCLGIHDQVEILIPALSPEQVIEFYRSAVEGMIGPEMYPHGHNWRDRFMMKSRAQWPNAAARHELRGKDLACWCPPDQPCHADVLLEIANR
jgi:hypothetical protein